MPNRRGISGGCVYCDGDDDEISKFIFIVSLLHRLFHCIHSHRTAYSVQHSNSTVHVHCTVAVNLVAALVKYHQKVSFR